MTQQQAQQHVNMGDGHFLPPGAKVNISEQEAQLTSGLEPVLERPDEQPIVEAAISQRPVESADKETPWEQKNW